MNPYAGSAEFRNAGRRHTVRDRPVPARRCRLCRFPGRRAPHSPYSIAPPHFHVSLPLLFHLRQLRGLDYFAKRSMAMHDHIYALISSTPRLAFGHRFKKMRQTASVVRARRRAGRSHVCKVAGHFCVGRGTADPLQWSPPNGSMRHGPMEQIRQQVSIWAYPH
jgi:hypothetical protein